MLGVAKKNSITLAGLLTLAVMLISTGLDLIKQGQFEYGVILVGVGFGVMLIGIFLYTEGIIDHVKNEIQKHFMGTGG